MNENSRGITHAYLKANVNENIAPEYESVNRLYKLFYPLKDLPQQTYDILQAGADSISDTEEFWRSALLTFCITPGWQIP